MKKLLLIYLSLISVYAIAGSGTAHLMCKSESGRTVFNAELQDIDGLLQNAKFTIDNVTMDFTEDDEAYTVFDPKNSVFTLYIQGKTNKQYPLHKFIEFWAIPSTFKIIKNSMGDELYEFRAKIFGTEPRQNKESQCPVIELICTLEYKI